jgi:hypothetical protein
MHVPHWISGRLCSNLIDIRAHNNNGQIKYVTFSMACEKSPT